MNNTIVKLMRILQEVSLLDSAAAQIKIIVDSISAAVGSDVCSLYRADANGDMVLLASHGFSVAEKVCLPSGKGLVGLIARQKHVLNIADALNHPEFFFVADSNESRFQGFCGVPLIHNGKVIGVLVVQSEMNERFGDETEAFLVTLASQLSMILSSLPLLIDSDMAVNLHLNGVSGAAGIGIGSTRMCGSEDLGSVADALSQDPEGSIRQWKELLDLVRSEIAAEKAMLSDSLSDEITGIFDAYEMIVSDKSLSDRVEKELHAGNWLPGALRKSIFYFADLFESADDPYLSARHEDILHLGQKLYRAWQSMSNSGDRELEEIDRKVILVGKKISVSDIARVPREFLAGIVCFEGSSLAHTAVLANALGIPAVMGVDEYSGFITNEMLIVNGNDGIVIVHPGKLVAKQYSRMVRDDQSLKKSLESLKNLPAKTRDGQRIVLFANTGLQADIEPGLQAGAEGIGLYRTEIPFMIRDSFPGEEEQLAVYQKVFDAYAGKPVYMRTLDIGGDKQLPYFPIHGESNPALGWRGIRFSLDNVQLLMTQVRAMIRAAGGSESLHILLPMISCTEELNAFIVLLEDACDQLCHEGVAIVKPKLGIMVEVPAAISQLVFWKDKLDFVSVGSNDLSQYLLALDRDNGRVAKRYDHVHPAVLHEINRTVCIARQCELALGVCGEMASDPVAIVLLTGMGVKQLSMSAAKLPRAKALIRSIEYSWASKLFHEVERLDNAADIRAFVMAELQRETGWNS